MIQSQNSVPCNSAFGATESCITMSIKPEEALRSHYIHAVEQQTTYHLTGHTLRSKCKAQTFDLPCKFVDIVMSNSWAITNTTQLKTILNVKMVVTQR